MVLGYLLIRLKSWDPSTIALQTERLPIKFIFKDWAQKSKKKTLREIASRFPHNFLLRKKFIFPFATFAPTYQGSKGIRQCPIKWMYIPNDDFHSINYN